MILAETIEIDQAEMIEDFKEEDLAEDAVLEQELVRGRCFRRYVPIAARRVKYPLDPVVRDRSIAATVLTSKEAWVAAVPDMMRDADSRNIREIAGITMGR